MSQNWPSIIISKNALQMDNQGDAPGAEKAKTMDALDNTFDVLIESQMSSINGNAVWIWNGNGITIMLPDPKKMSRRRYDIQGAKITVTLEPTPSFFELAAEAMLFQQELAEKAWRKTWKGWLKTRFTRPESAEKRAKRKQMTARFLANIWIESLQQTLRKWSFSLS